jgi:serine/threonine-protein kinase
MPLRVIIADDSVLLREGVARILHAAGIEVSGVVGDAIALYGAVADAKPDVCLIDIRMPPTHTDEGLVVARQIRREHPDIGVLILSQYVDDQYVVELLEENDRSVGYLLKDSVLSPVELVSAVERVASGEIVLDPTLVRQLLVGGRERDPIAELSERERSVLQLMSQGMTDKAIAEALFISVRTVQTHVGSIFTKLGVPDDARSNRRVHAILTWLQR